MVFLQTTPLSDNALTKYAHFIKYQKLGIAFLEIVSNIIKSVRKRVLINIHLSPPNQSLKLTEPAVDDFARAKIGFTIGRSLPRADWLPRRRGSPPHLSSGPLGGKKN